MKHHCSECNAHLDQHTRKGLCKDCQDFAASPVGEGGSAVAGLVTRYERPATKTLPYEPVGPGANAYFEGRRAWESGQPLSCNPYVDVMEECWNNGWREFN